MKKKSKKYDNFLNTTIGEGLIADDTIFLAELLYDLFSQDLHIEKQIQSLLSLSKFQPYLEILEEFGMANLRTSAFMISQIYPLSQFLGPDDRPIVEKIKTDRGTKTTRCISEARFKSRMGAAPSREFSGQSKKFKKRGSSEARLVLWQWFRVRVEFGKMPDSEAGAQIITWWREGRDSGIPVKKLRAKCRSKAMGLLFRHLCKKLL